MALQPKIIKSSAFVDGTYMIKAAPAARPLGVSGDPGPFGSDGELDVDVAPAIDPRVAAAEAEAEMVTTLAREEAARLIAEARAEATALREQATESGRVDGHAEGLSLGRQEGLHAIEQEEARRLEVLGEAIAAHDREAAARAEAHAQELAKLAIVIAQKVLAVELGHGRDAAIAMARAALQKVTDKAQVRLRVHPLDRTAIVAAKEQLLLSVDGLTHLDVVADPNVGLGGCVIETRTGLVDAKLSTQLEEIAAAMLDVRAGVEEGGEMDPVVQAALRALGRGVQAPEPRVAPRPVVEMPPRVPRKAPAPTPVAPVKDAAAEAEALLAAARAEAAQLIALAQAEAEVRVTRVVAEPEPAIEPVAIEIAAIVEAALPEPEQLFADLAPAPAVEAVVEAEPEGPKVDPSKRAAQALSARLGQMRAGRAVLSIEEELRIKELERRERDEALEELVRQQALPTTDIGLTEQLVLSKPILSDAADALAARLGQKVKEKKRVPEGALADDAISAVLDGVGLRAAGEDPHAAHLPAEPAAAPNIEKATDNLAKLLGEKRKGPRKAWYETLEG